MFGKFVLYIIITFNSLSLFSESELDRIIPPEIKNDGLYNAIYRLSQNEHINNILEIGSSSGDGSTQAFIEGINKNPNKPILFCMEVSKPRFAVLKQRYKDLTYVKCYNLSSVKFEDFPQETDVIYFYNNIPTTLNMYTCDRIIGWLRQDIEYLKSSGITESGIDKIKFENNITNFDMVLIDGSEFTGMAEFKKIYGAKFIILDDINAFKNYANYQSLITDPNYELIEKDVQLRNGYAIFKLKNM